MINAKSTDTGINIAAVGDDIKKLKDLPSTLKVVPVGVKTNVKTGHKQYVISLEVDTDAIVSLEVDTNARKEVEDNLKLAKNEISKLKAEIKNLKESKVTKKAKFEYSKDSKDSE